MSPAFYRLDGYVVTVYLSRDLDFLPLSEVHSALETCFWVEVSVIPQKQKTDPKEIRNCVFSC